MIWLHAICMMLSWGFLLPLGVIFARYYKEDPRVVRGKPLWFRGHQACQYGGVVLQLLGFLFIAIHKGVFNIFRLRGAGKLHLLIGDLVVVLGFAQPFIASVRVSFTPCSSPPQNSFESASANPRKALQNEISNLVTVIGDGFTNT